MYEDRTDDPYIREDSHARYILSIDIYIHVQTIA